MPPKIPTAKFLLFVFTILGINAIIFDITDVMAKVDKIVKINYRKYIKEIFITSFFDSVIIFHPLSCILIRIQSIYKKQ